MDATIGWGTEEQKRDGKGTSWGGSDGAPSIEE